MIMYFYYSLYLLLVVVIERAHHMGPYTTSIPGRSQAR